MVPWGSGNPRGNPRDTPDDELAAKEERWHEAWRLDRLGVGSREVGRRMGVSRTTAQLYVKRWEELVAGSRNLVEERNHQLATLERLQQKLWREAEQGDVTWAAATGPLRAVLSDRREILGFGTAAATPAAEGARDRSESVGRALAVVRDLGDGRKTG